MKLCADAFNAAVKDARKFTNGTFTITWQPLTTALVKAAREAGGDALDLDPKDGPILGMLFLSAVPFIIPSQPFLAKRK